jgi:hypothetical protein
MVEQTLSSMMRSMRWKRGEKFPGKVSIQ